MLNTLEALAGKISPGSGKNSPQQPGLDNNGYKACKSCNHNNIHPYMKPQHHHSQPQLVQQQQQSPQQIQQHQLIQNSTNNDNSPKEK